MNNLIKEVINVVKEAGQISLKQNFKIYKKDGFCNIATSVDIEVEKYLFNKLEKIIPGSSFFAEEDDYVEGNEYIWIIDPIDGTTNFSRGINQFCISVALKYKDEIILGVVYSPKSNELYYSDGNFSYLNDEVIHVSNRPLEDSLLCTAMSIYKKEYATICNEIIMSLYPRINDYRRFGSCALELCYLASGKCDLYFEIRVYSWDCAAASFILKNAGGVIRTINDKELNYTKKPFPLIGTNNLENYACISSIINDKFKKIGDNYE